MTQDQPGQAQGTDYVVRGEVVPDDETEAFEAEQSGPMTRLRKVASALRGDQADQTVPDQTLPDETVPYQAVPDQTRTDQTVPNQAVPMSRDMPAAARPDDVGAVRSPDAEDHDYWDEQDMRETAHEEGEEGYSPILTLNAACSMFAKARARSVSATSMT